MEWDRFWCGYKRQSQVKNWKTSVFQKLNHKLLGRSVGKRVTVRCRAAENIYFLWEKLSLKRLSTEAEETEREQL